MTKEQIIEGNKLIAEFMGERFEDFNGSIALSHEEEGVWYYDPVVYLDYNSDWSLLMPVVEKIMPLVYRFDIGRNGVNVMSNSIGKNHDVFWKHGQYVENNISVKSLIWLVVVEFIKWHNLNNLK